MLPSFPSAQTAQIIRAHQRDIIDAASLREQTENVTRALIGTRRLAQWMPEVNLAARLVYYGLTTGQGIQTLGEEYTDIWLHGPTHRSPSRLLNAALALLPSLPPYLLSRLGGQLAPGSFIRRIPAILEIFSEINLAIFYLRGTYYNLTKRALRIEYLSTIPESPYMKPPSYSLLGILLGVRLMYRLVSYLRSRSQDSTSKREGKQLQTDGDSEVYIDDRPVSELLAQSCQEESETPMRAEDDQYTWMDMANVSDDARAGRSCTLCLEERTASCATECGHLFCWNCIVGWGREKAECPLCRQSLNLTRLLPVYNL